MNNQDDSPDKVDHTYGRSDTTPHQDPLSTTAGPDVSSEVRAAIRWVMQNPGIPLTHFRSENHHPWPGE